MKSKMRNCEALWVLVMVLCASVTPACAQGSRGTGGLRLRTVELSAPPTDPSIRDTMKQVKEVRRALDDTTGRMTLEALGSITIDGDRLLVARVESTYGTGFYQSAYYFLSEKRDGPPVWSALATERFTPGGPIVDPPYGIGSCLFIVSDSLLGYVATSSSEAGRKALSEALKRTRMPADSVARRSGLYRWDRRRGMFHFLRSATKQLLDGCTVGDMPHSRSTTVGMRFGARSGTISPTISLRNRHTVANEDG